MKYDAVAPIFRGFITEDKELIEKGFSSAIANETNARLKSRLSSLYSDYKYRNGQPKVFQLDSAIKPYVMPPSKDFCMEDMVLSDDIVAYTQRILKEWASADKLLDNGLEPVHKLLLVGPPGNGKTSYAVSLSKLLGLPLLLTNSSLLFDSALGHSEKNVSLMFTKIPDRCMLFFDEFDALATMRKNADASAQRAYNSIVTTFLVYMEALKPSVFFMAATNVPDFLDKAVVRRFDDTLTFGAPTLSAKKKFFEHYLQKYGLDANAFAFEEYQIENAPSFSDLELVLKARHKELILEQSH